MKDGRPSIMYLGSLETILKNYQTFRLKQVKQAIFWDLVEDWQEAKWLPKELRERLNKECPLKINAQNFYSKRPACRQAGGSTVKSLITLKDGLKVESVLMRHDGERKVRQSADHVPGRNTVCVSSQVGCPLGCLFCATGKIGFKRNLEAWEIIEQVVNFKRLLKNIDQTGCIRVAPLRVQPSKATNIVFMGMGEPFLNYENVISAIKIINDPEGLAIGARHISISTVGIIDGIKKLAKESIQVNLAISLHAPNNKLRTKLIPINSRYSIEKIMGAVGDYIQRTNRKVMFEYLMIKDLNDSEDLAYELVSLLKKVKKPLIMVNLIRYNPTGIYQPSTTERVEKFKKILMDKGIFVTERYRFGQDIKAACGQLAGKIPEV